MNSSKQFLNHLIKILYLLIMLLSSFLFIYSYLFFYKKETLDTLLPYLNACVSELGHTIEQNIEEFDYTSSLLLNSSEMIALESEKMTLPLGKLLFYYPSISNAYVINKEGDLIYGVNNNELIGNLYTTHINTALDGSIGYYSTVINEQPFIQVALPILSGNMPSGSLVLTFNMSSLQKVFQRFTSHVPTLQIYLLDTNGLVLTTSASYKGANQSIPIQNIRHALDYAPTETINLHNRDNLYGSYSLIRNSNWILLITCTLPKPSFTPLLVLSLLNVVTLLLIIFLYRLQTKSHLLFAIKKHTTPYNNSTKGNGWI